MATACRPIPLLLLRHGGGGNRLLSLSSSSSSSSHSLSTSVFSVTTGHRSLSIAARSPMGAQKWHGRTISATLSYAVRSNTTTTASTAESNQCADNLVALLEGSSEASALSLARQLSPDAQQEIAHIRQQQPAAAATTTAIPEPTPRDLQLVALNQLIPFVGFGIVDNAILIVAGDFIDTTLGVMLGISTLCAAAIGNIVSDVFGVGLGTAIEDFCATYLSIPQANITQAQRQLRSVRFASQWGCAVGITIGCIIGMFPLLFIDSTRVERLKQERLLDTLFHDVITQAKTLIHADATCLYLLVNDLYETLPASGARAGAPTQQPSSFGNGDRFLYAKFVEGPPATSDSAGNMSFAPTHVVPLGRGIVSRAVLTREAINVYDARTEPDFNPKGDVIQGFSPDQVKSMACVPVVDGQGKVIAVLQAIQKVESLQTEDSNVRTRGFTAQHVQQLQALASHVSMALQTMKDEEARVSLRHAVEILKDHGTPDNTTGATTLVGQLPPPAQVQATQRKRRPLFPEARDQSAMSSPYRA